MMANRREKRIFMSGEEERIQKKDIRMEKKKKVQRKKEGGPAKGRNRQSDEATRLKYRP
jgi:hypothetical protein